jgi:hypothetical protein
MAKDFNSSNHRRHDADNASRFLRVIRYKLVSCPSIEEFNAKAEEMIEDGLQPYGKVHILMESKDGQRRCLFSQAFAEYKS